jgi:hypothetical protein
MGKWFLRSFCSERFPFSKIPKKSFGGKKISLAKSLEINIILFEWIFLKILIESYLSHLNLHENT